MNAFFNQRVHVAAIAMLAAGSGLGWAFTHLIA